jgi:hypothetical protein
MDEDDISEARIATLCKRFPTRPREEVKAALSASAGDQRIAAAKLATLRTRTRTKEAREAEEQTNTALRTLFRLLDADDDGFLTQSESRVMARSFECNEETFWRLLQKYDADNDELISLDEFMAAMKGRVWSAFFRHGGGPVDERSVHEEAVVAHAKISAMLGSS